VLYRAGRWREAIDRLTEGITADRDSKLAEDWIFLAMAHQRLADPDKAGHYLGRARSLDQRYQGISTLARAELELLRAEAEAVIRDDPILPVDPFVP
jgi:hypothetical protein